MKPLIQPSQSQAFDIEKFVPPGDDKSKLGKCTSIAKTIPISQLRDLKPNLEI